MVKPNFFIIGAPKCGTTSLAAWLSQNDKVLISVPKEPFFFSPDIVPSVYKTEAHYERLFRNASPQHLAVGEASTTYLQSKLAVPKILVYQPDARFVVMLRSPVEMAESLHAQQLYSLNENVESFEDAWRLQGDRRRGKKLPWGCRSVELLQYGHACLLGSHLERLYSLVPSSRVKVIFLEDMQTAPANVYTDVTAFLGVPNAPMPSFFSENKRKTHRSRLVKRMFKAYEDFKLATGIHLQTGMLSTVAQWNRKPLARSPTRSEFRSELIDYFTRDIEKIERLTGRCLQHWKECI